MYGNDVAKNVMDKAKRMCKDLQDVSELFLFFKGTFVI